MFKFHDSVLLLHISSLKWILVSIKYKLKPIILYQNALIVLSKSRSSRRSSTLHTSLKFNIKCHIINNNKGILITFLTTLEHKTLLKRMVSCIRRCHISLKTRYNIIKFQSLLTYRLIIKWPLTSQKYNVYKNMASYSEINKIQIPIIPEKAYTVIKFPEYFS